MSEEWVCGQCGAVKAEGILVRYPDSRILCADRLGCTMRQLDQKNTEAHDLKLIVWDLYWGLRVIGCDEANDCFGYCLDAGLELTNDAWDRAAKIAEPGA